MSETKGSISGRRTCNIRSLHNMDPVIRIKGTDSPLIFTSTWTKRQSNPTNNDLLTLFYRLLTCSKRFDHFILYFIFIKPSGSSQNPFTELDLNTPCFFQ